MGLLNNVKETSQQIDTEREEKANELLTVRQELIETRKREEQEREDRDKESKRYRHEIDRVSQERSLIESEYQA